MLVWRRGGRRDDARRGVSMALLRLRSHDESTRAVCGAEIPPDVCALIALCRTTPEEALPSEVPDYSGAGRIPAETSRRAARNARAGCVRASRVPPQRRACEDFARQLKDARIDYDAAAPFALDIIWRIPDLAKRLAEPPHQWLHWSPTAGLLRATCLDASRWIAECLAPFGGSILMSATLAPIQRFRERCGLTRENSTLAQGHAPWRDDAYHVAIDTRVDTRYKQRDKHYETTARTIAALINQSPGVPVAVFFASYLYAENIKAYLDALTPGTRIQVQPRGVDLAEQETFIDEGLLMADALFLILGSSYAEGVDKLGGRIDIAMVVGPALPEVNAIQDAKMEAHPSTERNAAFKDVYIIPAMRRIHQALGRIVRAPGQRAKVLLHGKRYAEAAYQEQLAPEYQDASTITNDQALADWLEQK